MLCHPSQQKETEEPHPFVLLTRTWHWKALQRSAARSALYRESLCPERFAQMGCQ